MEACAPPVKPAILLREVPIRDIVVVTANWYDISLFNYLSHCRAKEIIWPRMYGMYLARVLTGLSFEKIGREFGGRDHCIVRYAYTRVRREGKNPALARELEDIVRTLVV